MAHDFTDVDFMLTTLDEMLSEKGETLTKTHKVRELLFDGFSVQAFLDLLSDPMVEAAGGDVKVPEQILDGKMGILEGVYFFTHKLKRNLKLSFNSKVLPKTFLFV